jgi:hypothetical protein
MKNKSKIDVRTTFLSIVTISLSIILKKDRLFKFSLNKLQVFLVPILILNIFNGTRNTELINHQI